MPAAPTVAPRPPRGSRGGDAWTGPRISATVQRRSRPSVFRPGDVVAYRFRIVRFLAKGGMGELYEAEDLELHERVALKTILSTTGQDERSVTMFKREVHLARQVTHPNVCRIFDVFRHRPPARGRAPTEQAADVVFLAMELLHGETLADRLRREGRLSTADALVLARQMAAALTAAHRAGVVHRDFKSHNVMLVEAGRAGRGRARRRHRLRPGQAQLGGRPLQRCPSPSNDAGEISGTPAYMAPEQVEGGPATPATESVRAGRRALRDGHGRPARSWPIPRSRPRSSGCRSRRRRRGPTCPTWTPRWEATILRCLARQPSDRFPSVAEAMAALEGRAASRRATARKEADRARCCSPWSSWRRSVPPSSGARASSAEAPRASPPSPCCPSPTPRRTRTRSTSRTASARA